MTTTINWNTIYLRPKDDPDRWTIDWLSQVLSKCGRFRLRRWRAEWGAGYDWLVEVRPDENHEFQRTNCSSTLKAAKKRCQELADQWTR